MNVKIIALIIVVITVGLGIYFMTYESMKEPNISEFKIEEPEFEAESTFDLGPLLEEEIERKKVRKPAPKKSELKIEMPSFEEGPTLDMDSLF